MGTLVVFQQSDPIETGFDSSKKSGAFLTGLNPVFFHRVTLVSAVVWPFATVLSNLEEKNERKCTLAFSLACVAAFSIFW